MCKVYYSKNHIRLEIIGEEAVLGLSSYACKKLGNILFITLPDAGEALKIGECFGDIESVKTVSDLISPVDGIVVEVNEELVDDPEAIQNEFDAWLVKVRINELPNDILTEEEYEQIKGEL